MRNTMIICTIVTLALAGQASASVIFADTTGADNFNTPEFYGVEHLSGSAGAFIQSVTYDISLDNDAFFDFDGKACFDNQLQPVLGTLVGLNAGDISFDLLNPLGDNPLHPTRLRINFAAGAFGVGDSIRFATDTDWLGPVPTSGRVFGEASVPISVTMFGGAVASANFETVTLDPTRSEATIVVPEPATMLLLGLGGMLIRKRK